MLSTTCIVAGMILATPDYTLLYTVPLDRDFKAYDPLIELSQLTGKPISLITVEELPPLSAFGHEFLPCAYLASIY